MNTEMTERHDEQHTGSTPPPPGWRHVRISRVPKGGSDGGRIGGVVAGVSRAYGFDLHTTRIATVVAMLVLPVLLLVYAAAWILLPATPAQAVPLDAVLRDRRRMPLLLAIGLVLVVGGLGSLGSWFLFRGAPWGVILIGIGILLWLLADRHHPAAAPTLTATFPPPVPGTNAELKFGEQGPVHAELEFGEKVRRARRVRRPIASIGLGVTALWFVVAGTLSALGWWHSPSLWVLVSGIGIVLAALLVSTIVNRSWFLPAPFTLLALVLIGLCIARPNLEGGSGTRDVHPASVAAATVPQHLAAGRLTVDLRDVPLGASDVVVHAEVGFGDLVVTVPPEATLQLTMETGMGATFVDGRKVMDGIRQHESRTVAATTAEHGTIVLDLRVGMGKIDVRRAP